MATIVTLIICIVFWGMALRALEDTYHYIIDPILRMIVGPNKKNRIIYYPVCFVFMTLHRAISVGPFLGVFMLILWFASLSDKFGHYFTQPNTIYYITGGLLLLLGLHKTIERSRKDYYDTAKDPYFNMTVDELIEASNKTLANIDRYSRNS